MSARMQYLKPYIKMLRDEFAVEPVSTQLTPDPAVEDDTINFFFNGRRYSISVPYAGFADYKTALVYDHPTRIGVKVFAPEWVQSPAQIADYLRSNP